MLWGLLDRWFRRRPPDETRARLADGRAIALRPIRPADEDSVIAFFDRLEPEDVRMRFFASLNSMSHAMAAHLTRIDPAREMAYVALSVDPRTGRAAGRDILGVVRLAETEVGRVAEFAIVVRSDLKRRGLGRILMAHIIDHARGRGLSELTGDVLAENEPMLKLAHALGFHIKPSPETPSIDRVRLNL
jgi:acetyltransferase